MEIPQLVSAPPAPWWGQEEDQDLMISVNKHGYQQYEKMKLDPELCFYKRLYGNYIPEAEASSSVQKDDMNVDPAPVAATEGIDTPPFENEDNESMAEMDVVDEAEGMAATSSQFVRLF